MLKRSFFALLGLVAVLLAALLIQAARHGSRQLQVAAATPLALDLDAASRRLAATLRLKTVSSADDPNLNLDQFAQLHTLLRDSYPMAHVHLTREVVGNATLLFRWDGSDKQALPVLWMAHQDVVPVAPGTEQDWSEVPFAGVVKDGYIWGRGSWDDKGNLCAQLEAVEQLIAAGFKPRRTLYLAFGADEEAGGVRGAKAVAALLAARGVHFDYVLDEGLLVTDGMLKGLDKPAALIGIAEKGYATIKLDLSTAPGHASMPPAQSGIGMMSEALARLEREQFRPDLHGVAREMLESAAPEMEIVSRIALSNLWLSKPLLEHQLAKVPSTNAMLRTTTALTIVQAGNKDNVLPGTVQATVNFRILPGDSVAKVMDHVRRTVANDDIKITLQAGAEEPSPISPTGSSAYHALNRTIRSVFTDAVVVPGLMIGATDSRYLARLSDNVFKFTPVRAKPDDLKRFHGTNERLAQKNFGEMIQFYAQLLKNS
jgi:carboxypeptidase PM20D1